MSQQGATAAEVDKNVPNYTVMGIEYDGNTGLPVDETPTMKMEVIGKPITQWYDLEGEFDYNVPMLIFEKTKLQTIIQQE